MPTVQPSQPSRWRDRQRTLVDQRDKTGLALRSCLGKEPHCRKGRASPWESCRVAALGGYRPIGGKLGAEGIGEKVHGWRLRFVIAPTVGLLCPVTDVMGAAVSASHNSNPDIRIWMSTTERLVNFAAEGVDAAIRLGHGTYPGLCSVMLLREWIFPVATPVFLRDYGKPESPADLLQYPLFLRDSAEIVPKWDYWFEQNGVELTGRGEGPRFPHTNMAILAALAGQGIALVRSAHVDQELATGKLVKLFDTARPSPVAYYLVCPKGAERQRKIRIFRQWIRQHAERAQKRYDVQANGHVL